MFSIMDFFPTLASIVGSKMPTDRPIDGVDQCDVLFGKSVTGHRDSLLSFRFHRVRRNSPKLSSYGIALMLESYLITMYVAL